MSTLHDVFRTALGSLVSQRYYPNKFPQEAGAPTWPAIRGTIISRENDPDQCDGGDFDTDTVRVQLDVVATTYEAAEDLMRAVDAALTAVVSVPIVRQPGGFETWDADARVHRLTADWLVMQSSP